MIFQASYVVSKINYIPQWSMLSSFPGTHSDRHSQGAKWITNQIK